ncbi:hypothetical protein H5410_020955, partial [Solanum commersonii]
KSLGQQVFWLDDWLGLGALAKHSTTVSNTNTGTVHQFRVEGQWNDTMIIKLNGIKDMTNSHNWHKHIPFNISFLNWRALRGKFRFVLLLYYTWGG